MSTVILICVAAVFMLSMALWHCYKTNKPLREKARKEAEEKDLKARKEQAAIAEQMRRNKQREETFEDFDRALSDPHRFLSVSPTSIHTKWRYSHLAELVNLLKELKAHRQEFGSTAERLDKQSQLIRDQRSQIKALQGNVEDIKKALQMGSPVEL